MHYPSHRVSKFGLSEVLLGLNDADVLAKHETTLTHVRIQKVLSEGVQLNFDNFFLMRGEMIQKLAIIGPPAKRQLKLRSADGPIMSLH